MSDFHHRRIESEPGEIRTSPSKRSFLRYALRIFPRNREEFKTRKISAIFATTLVILAMFFIYKVVSTTIFYVSNFKPSDLIFIFAGNSQVDELDRTNFLLIGTGGGDHDAPDLTDSIIVASYNHKSEIASMLSIPRDLYVTMPGYGSSRINKIYETLKPQIGSTRALEVLKESVEGVVDLDLHYYVKIDFDGFMDVVDILGGVDIDVKERLYDEAYPDEKNGYGVLDIKKGLQHMDGEMALKYARSRHSTSDFDRAQRQQELLIAIKEKALSEKLLTSPIKLKKLWDEFKENIETNMSTTEMMAFTRIAKDFDTSKMVSKVLKDIEIVQEGGFLYTPERQYYNGAFVLRPWGETYEAVHKYAAMIFEDPEFYLENARVEIQNGTSIPGAASKLMDYLTPYGVNIVRIGNTPDKTRYEKTHYFSVDPEADFSLSLRKLGELLYKGKESSAFGSKSVKGDSDVVIVIGSDFPLVY